MKTFLKITAIVFGAIVLLIVIGAAYINFSGIPVYDTEKVELQVHATPQAVERGRRLVSMLCANCHMNRETRKLTGKKLLDVPPEFGEIYSPNITQDKEYGIGNWTDGELLYLLRTGIRKDGRYCPPYMAKLPLMADDDLKAIIAFLRSDHPMVTADPTPDTPPQPSFLTKLLCRIAFKPLPMPAAPIAMPDTTNTVAWGEYLAHNLDCYACHSADFKTNNYLDPPKSKGYFAGGNKLYNEEGDIVLSANLTPDKETGIGNWQKEEFIRAVRFGIGRDNRALAYPMLPYAQMTEAEAGAIYDYLQTIPPVVNKVSR